jgi:hypothetical protein
LDLSKSSIFEKINKIENPLIKLTKRKRERSQTPKLRDEKENVRKDANDIQKITGEHFENSYFIELENVEDMDKLLEAQHVPKLNQKNINHLKRSIRTTEIEAGIVS